MKRRLTFFLSSTLLVATLLWATTQGPNSAGLGVNVAGSGVDWSGPTNIYTSNDVRAQAALAASGQSDYLRSTTYGFTLPSGTVNGIQLEIERSQTGTGLCQDFAVYIVKGGSETGTDHAAAGQWPTTDAYQSYGGAADLWGTAWTVGDINATNFGASVIVNETGGTDACTGRVDHMRITVYYTAGGVPKRQILSSRRFGGAGLPTPDELRAGAPSSGRVRSKERMQSLPRPTRTTGNRFIVTAQTRGRWPA
jgi:hypothetical protein